MCDHDCSGQKCCVRHWRFEISNIPEVEDFVTSRQIIERLLTRENSIVHCRWVACGGNVTGVVFFRKGNRVPRHLFPRRVWNVTWSCIRGHGANYGAIINSAFGKNNELIVGNRQHFHSFRPPPRPRGRPVVIATPITNDA